jgi:type III pantothenate kinase
MSVTICFDFGNTRLKAAIFKNKALLEMRVLENDHLETIQALLHEINPDKTILSSVIHHDKAIETQLAAHSKFHLLGPALTQNSIISICIYNSYHYYCTIK